MRAVTLRPYGQVVTLDVDEEDHIGRLITKSRQFYELDLLEDARTRVKSGVAVDVGAHIGNHALWFDKVCNLDVVALEPYPPTFNLLTRNIEANKANVRPLRLAAGVRKQNGSIVPPRQGNSGTTQVRPGRGDVHISPLDDLGLEDVTLLKVDVEGSGVEVLVGARRMINQYKPIVYVEGDRDACLAELPDGYYCFGRFARTPTWGFAWHSPVKVSVSVMAHPKRKRFVQELLALLDGPAQVIWDTANDRWDTGRRALLASRPDATHHLVIQDDVLPCRELLAACHRLLHFVPDGHPVSLYMGRSRTEPRRFNMGTVTRAARHKGARFAVFEGPWWGQGVIVPTSEIPGVVAFGDSHPHITNYDHRIAYYFVERGISCYYTMPSLIEHRYGPDNPSLLDHHGLNRRAAWFVGTDQGAAEFGWDRTITPRDLPSSLRQRFPPTPTYASA